MARFGKNRPEVQQKVVDPKTPQETTSVRAKSQGHKKKTADKWNQ
jgi:hypothetical protein